MKKNDISIAAASALTILAASPNMPETDFQRLVTRLDGSAREIAKLIFRRSFDDETVRAEHSADLVAAAQELVESVAKYKYNSAS
jgi:hypothetical protein